MNTTALHKELTYKSSRSSGSGGQHVNKVETRIELRFDVEGSALLSPEQKARVRDALGNRINKKGVLAVAAGKRRSQVLNRKAAISKFDRLMEKALRPRKRRRRVKALTANPAKRLEAKRQQSEKKSMRKKPTAGKNGG